MNKSEYSRNQRQRFATKLAKLIAPSGSGATLQAINDAMFPHLADLPDSAFNAHMPALIATKCTVLPDTAELRRLLLDALANTAGNDNGAGPQSARTKPALTDREIELVRRGQPYPGPMLWEWLQSRGVSRERWDQGANANRDSMARAKADWSDPEIVRASAAKLAGHPMAGILGRMLHALVERHAPQNLGWIPPHFHPVGEQTGR